MKGNYTIAVCDILGFSDLIEKASLDSIVNDALAWFAKALHHSLHHQNFPDHRVTLNELQSHQNS